jgi:hypothetical protein
MELSIANVLELNEQKILLLAKGIIYITTAIHLTSHTVICGAVENGQSVTHLKRGKTADGKLYQGPLIIGANITNAELKNLIIDGSRFEEVNNIIIDHRHPLESDRNGSWFPLTRTPADLNNHNHGDYGTLFDADVICSSASKLTYKNIQFKNSIKIGLGLGIHCCKIEIKDCRFEHAGDIGLWIGSNLGLPPLPLNELQKQQQPSNIRVERCIFLQTGASATHIDGQSISFLYCDFLENHCDFPYNESGGQIAIDYKSSDILIKGCVINNGPWLERNISLTPHNSQKKYLGACGIELAGENIQLIDNEIAGNATEAIHINGASNVWFAGTKTKIYNNQQLIRTKKLNGALEDIAITSSYQFSELNATTKDIYINNINIENGIIIWSDHTIPDLKIHQMIICNNSSTLHRKLPVKIQNNKAGKSLLGNNCSL